MAEQQAEAYKKKQEELRNQYEKEQDLHENKAMLSKDSKDKLSMNFMYEPPPGVRKERERDDNEPEYKFEWQRKYNAPRESYCKGDTEIRDQPFGIQVRNVRCIKCHKWGHINTDKECTWYSISMSEARKLHSEAEAGEIMSKGTLEEQMKEDGLAMKKGAMSAQSFQSGRLHQLVPDNEDGETIQEMQPESEFLKSLSTKQKKKLLKKLQKIEKLKQKSRHKRSEKKTKSHRSSSSSSSSSSSNRSEHEKDVRKRRENKNGKKDEKNRERSTQHRRKRSRSMSSADGRQSKKVSRSNRDNDKPDRDRHDEDLNRRRHRSRSRSRSGNRHHSDSRSRKRDRNHRN